MMIPHEQGYYRLIEDLGIWEPTTTCPIEPITGTKYARALYDIAYRHADGEGVSIAPKGEKFDGGSKPPPTWIWLGHPWGDYLLAYRVHDSECKHIRRILRSGMIDRPEARLMRHKSDRIFREGQIYIKRNLLDKAGSRIERMNIKLKYMAVRLQAWLTL